MLVEEFLKIKDSQLSQKASRQLKTQPFVYLGARCLSKSKISSKNFHYTKQKHILNSIISFSKFLSDEQRRHHWRHEQRINDKRMINIHRHRIFNLYFFALCSGYQSTTADDTLLVADDTNLLAITYACRITTGNI